MQRKGRQQKWKEKPRPETSSPVIASPSTVVTEAVTSRLSGLSIAECSRGSHIKIPVSQSSVVHTVNQNQTLGEKAIWKPRAYRTASGPTAVEAENVSVNQGAGEIQANGSKASASEASSLSLSKLFTSSFLQGFSVDNSSYSHAQVRATFYPKFENEKSDQEVLMCSWFLH